MGEGVFIEPMNAEAVFARLPLAGMVERTDARGAPSETGVQNRPGSVVRKVVAQAILDGSPKRHASA